MIYKFTGRAFALCTWMCCYLVLSVQKVFAADNELNLGTLKDPEVTPMPSMFALFLKLAVSLVIIVGLSYLTMRLLRKNLRFSSRGENINILDQYSFSLNKGIYITQIAGRIYVLGVTDQNISMITEITDEETVSEIIARAEEREKEGIVPQSIMDRFFSKLVPLSGSGNKSFNEHIKKQIKKLQSITENRQDGFREDDRNE